MSLDVLDAQSLGKLKWRCKRGLLENDLLIERFFERHAADLTAAQAQGLTVLMDLGDNDLLDLLLRRSEPEGEIDTREIKEVLAMMRPVPPSSAQPLGTLVKEANL
ncbi:MAG: succinate dehydrogenase assembly factor 2 [Rhizobacter sp.]